MSILYEGKAKKLNFFGHNSPDGVDFYCGGQLNDFAMVLINLKYRDRSLQESYTELLHLLVKGGCRVGSDMNPVEYDQTSGEMLVNKDHILRVPPEVELRAKTDPSSLEAKMISDIKEGFSKMASDQSELKIIPDESKNCKICFSD